MIIPKMLYLQNVLADGVTTVTTPTKNQVKNNTLRDNGFNNLNGDGGGVGYQAGIFDQGYGDTIQNNSICGAGYTASNSNATRVLLPIDVTTATAPVVKNNTTCSTASAETDVRARAISTVMSARPAVPQPIR